MKTRRLNIATHDMTFGQGMANYAIDDEAIGQNVKTRLLLIMGEWFLDDDAGLPYLTEIVKEPTNIDLAESLIKRCILGTLGVNEITAFGLDFDHQTRILSVSATLTTTLGTTKNIKIDRTT